MNGTHINFLFKSIPAIFSSSGYGRKMFSKSMNGPYFMELSSSRICANFRNTSNFNWSTMMCCLASIKNITSFGSFPVFCCMEEFYTFYKSYINV